MGMSNLCFLSHLGYDIFLIMSHLSTGAGFYFCAEDIWIWSRLIVTDPRKLTFLGNEITVSKAFHQNANLWPAIVLIVRHLLRCYAFIMYLGLQCPIYWRHFIVADELLLMLPRPTGVSQMKAMILYMLALFWFSAVAVYYLWHAVTCSSYYLFGVL